MKKQKKGLSVVLAMIVAVGTILAAPQAYAIRDLEVDPRTKQADKDSKYTITFELEEDLDKGETISIRFPDEYSIDKRLDERDVKVNGKRARSVDVDDNVIEIEVPQDLEDGDEVEIEISDGITNPDEEGKYTIKVRTENESWKSYTIKITGSSSSSGKFSVSLSDDKAGAETSYTLSKFSLSGSSQLEKGKTITITFPDDDMLPSKIDEDDVRINGYTPSSVTVDKDQVKLKIPSKVDGDDTLKVEFKKDAGIRNPEKGSHTITVSYDGKKYTSSKFTVKEGSTTSSSGSFDVSLSNQTPGANTSYSFEIDLGAKKLSYNNSFHVEFPASEMVPAYIAPYSITINGTTASNVAVNGNRVSVLTPYGFNPASKVKVVFDTSANLTNPQTAGDYQLKVTMANSTFTSKKFSISGSVSNTPTGVVDNSTATISLSKTALNTATGITINIKGVSVPLTRGQSFLELAMPVGFTVPETIQATHVTVNGVTPAYVGTRGQNVVIYPAQDLNANTAISVIIAETANIKTPSTAQAYSIGVYTSEEREALFRRSVGVGGVVVPSPIPSDAARLQLNVASYSKGGQTYPLAVAPYTANGNTLVPAQFFRDAMGLSTQWNENTAVIISGSTVIRFTVGADTAQIGQTTVKLPVAVQAKNGMPMLPIRFISDTLKYTLGWDGATSSIVIYK